MPNLVEEEISPEEQESEQNFHFPPEHEKNVLAFRMLIKISRF